MLTGVNGLYNARYWYITPPKKCWVGGESGERCFHGAGRHGEGAKGNATKAFANNHATTHTTVTHSDRHAWSNNSLPPPRPNP